RAPGRARGVAEQLRQVLDLDVAAGGEDHDRLERVAQLATVARPGVAGERVERLRRDPDLRLAVLLGEDMEEVLAQHRQVAGALAQRPGLQGAPPEPGGRE